MARSIDAGSQQGAAPTTAAAGSALPAAPGDSEASVASGPITEVAARVYPEPGVFSEMVSIGDGKILMFGGIISRRDGTAPLEGTWLFDATVGEWSVTEPDPTPSPRFGHAMALYPPTGKVVLFGGGTTQSRRCPRTRFCTGPEDNQVWQYDPGTGAWEDMTPSVPDEESWPSARFGTRLAYEPITERLIMFGGVGVFGDRFTPTFYQDTWAYDPVSNQWEQLLSGDELDVESPIGRTVYGLAWAEDARRLMLFGGDSLSNSDDDRLWAFDPVTSTWEDRGVAEIGPFDRWFHLLTVDPLSGRLVLIGGTGTVLTQIQGGTLRDVDPLGEVWIWSEAEGWLAQNPMVAPMSPVGGAGDEATGAIIVYDGHNVMSYDSTVDLWTSLAEREESDDG